MTAPGGRAGGAAVGGGTWRRLRPVVVVSTLVATVVALVVASLVLFVVPSVDDPRAIRDGGPVDAVVVLGGSPATRLSAAVSLTATLPGPPPTLALSVQYERPVLRCGVSPSLPDVTLTCFAPDPATTSGEARWIAEQAAAGGWGRVVVTTSAHHVTRARVLVQRCIEAISPTTDVLYHAAGSEPGSLRGVWRVATEWASLLATRWDHTAACDQRRG